MAVDLVTWLPLVVATSMLLVMFAIGAFSVSRDFFFLLVYLQSVIYVDISPTIAARSIPFASSARYEYFKWLVLVLFQLPLIALYWRRVRRLPAVHAIRDAAFSRGRAMLLFGGMSVLAVGYYWVAIKHGLLYRRLAEDLPIVQLELGLAEFAVYRVFIELGGFLVALELYALRRMPPADRRLLWVPFVVAVLAYLGYALVNSRMMSLTFMATLYGVYLLTARTRLQFRAPVVLGALVAVIMAGYSMRVVTNVRQSVAAGEGIFAAQNFLPIALDRQKEEDPLSWRLNGLDLMALISDNVEAFGPAWGKAWAIPFVISLDPIVRTDFTEQAKRVALTTPKAFLLLMYAGIARPDYYNCMLTDAYGNLGVAGFLVVAVVVAFLLGLAVKLLSPATASMWGALVGLFVITRVLPFEQEFATLLFGWLKATPILFVAWMVYPLRPVRRA